MKIPSLRLLPALCLLFLTTLARGAEPAAPPPPDELGRGSLIAIIAVVLVVIGMLYVAWVVWNKASQAAGDKAGDDAYARVRLAMAVTLGAMSFIVVVSVVMILFAGVNAALPPWRAEKTQLFFDMGKWVLGAVLPVVGAWVGGVMAYYFGKDNFTAGVQSTTALVRELTPQQKLASRKAGDAGLVITNLRVIGQLAPGTKLRDMDLTPWHDGFKGFERLPILDDQGRPLACLHYSTLTRYLMPADPGKAAAPPEMKLGALIDKVPWNPLASFKTVQPDDDLSRVQAQLNATKECADVFVTADGTVNAPVQRWITDQDIVKIAST